MGSTRRSFTDEYKASAASLVLDEQRPIAEVARNIDVHAMTLGRWVKKEREDREAAQPPDEPLRKSERAELIRLHQDYKAVRAENTEFQMQVSFAKKWRPGSRKSSSEVCCDRGLGGFA